MKNNKEWFQVIDVAKFIESTRVLIFNSFGKTNENQPDELSLVMEDLPKTEIEELNTVLTQEECVIMSKEFLKERKNNKTKQTIFLITNQKYMEMIECFNNRMISNMLNNLVNKGLLETAYDSESNDFVFWIKDNDKNQNEKPETD
jgi:hypothetical protein